VNSQPDLDLNFGYALAALRRRAALVVVITVVVTVATFVAVRHERKQYTATASLVFGGSSNTQVALGLVPQAQSPQPSSDVALVQMSDTAALTARRLGGGITGRKITQMVSISAVGQTNVVTVAATSPMPAFATRVANAYAEEFVESQNAQSTAYYSHALKVVTAQLAALGKAQRASSTGLNLESRSASLSLLAEIATGGVTIGQAATLPVSPSSPRAALDTAIAFLGGLFIAIALVFILEGLDRDVREPDELASIYGVSLIGAVPIGARPGRAEATTDHAPKVPSVEPEAFNLLLAHLRYFNVDRQVKTVLVTSVAPQDGKTTVTIQLAAAAARMGERVLILDTDLRRSTVSSVLGVDSGPGLADVLIGEVTLAGAVQTVDVGPSLGPKRGTLDVLVAGSSTPPSPASLIDSNAMEHLLEEASEGYDRVFVDTAPVNVVADALPLLGKVDGVVVVARIGSHKRDGARRLRETLEAVETNVLGVVANGVRRREEYYYGPRGA
jgi:capsular exopolysaccharide synthesis family protein